MNLKCADFSGHGLAQLFISSTVALLLPVLTIGAERSSSLFSSQSTQTSAIQKNSPTKIKWKTGLIGKSLEDDFVDERSSGFLASAIFTHKLYRHLAFKVRGDLWLETGSRQNLGFDDAIPKSGIYLKEANINWSPFKYFSFKAGAVSQAHFHSELFFSESKSLPGVQEIITWKTNPFQLQAFFQQAILTSQTLATANSDRETTPTIYSESLRAKWRVFKNFRLLGFVSHFAFSELPSSVAQESGLYGNTVTNTGGTNATFDHEFNGWLAGWQMYWRILGGLSIKGGADMLVNTSAPEGLNRGQLVYGEAKIGLSKKLNIIPRGEWFFNESDSSPAYYNSSLYGHNNRQGWAAGVEFSFPKQKFSIKGKFISSEPITEQPHLPIEQRTYLISVETNYAEI